MFNPGFVLAIALALVHGFAPKLSLLFHIPRFRWTSFAGGVSLTYVFLKIFPDLSYTQEKVAYLGVPLIPHLKNQVYILALLGLVIFHRLDLWAYKSKISTTVQRTSAIFWVHLGAFGILNAITGYLLQDLSQYSLVACILFFIPLGLYFFIIDDNLREHQQRLYDRRGRWFLVSAIVFGTVIGQFTSLNETIIAIVWSFLAGTIILNVLKRELPDEKQSCFWSFVFGTIFYTGLLLCI